MNRPPTDEETWQFARFERETRYYELRLQQDLFGWVLVMAWGRKSTRLGQMRTRPAAISRRLCGCGMQESANAIAKATS